VARERAPGGPKALDQILGVRFRDASLRQLALTHRSYAFENELPANNERLEFLGVRQAEIEQHQVDRLALEGGDQAFHGRPDRALLVLGGHHHRELHAALTVQRSRFCSCISRRMSSIP